MFESSSNNNSRGWWLTRGRVTQITIQPIRSRKIAIEVRRLTCRFNLPPFHFLLDGLHCIYWQCSMNRVMALNWLDIVLQLR